MGSLIEGLDSIVIMEELVDVVFLYGGMSMIVVVVECFDGQLLSGIVGCMHAQGWVSCREFLLVVTRRVVGMDDNLKWDVVMLEYDCVIRADEML